MELVNGRSLLALQMFAVLKGHHLSGVRSPERSGSRHGALELAQVWALLLVMVAAEPHSSWFLKKLLAMSRNQAVASR